MFGIIETVFNSYGRGYYIRVDGYRETGFYGYSKRDAIGKYRRENNLKYKRINWIEI